jgi:hypothetical protein
LTEQIKRVVNIVIDDIDRRIRKVAEEEKKLCGDSSADHVNGLLKACDIIAEAKKEINE